MRSEIAEKQKEKQVRSYPKLMSLQEKYKKSGSLIVLFTQATTGTVVHCDRSQSWSIGEYHTMWDPKQFEDYEEQIILSN